MAGRPQIAAWRSEADAVIVDLLGHADVAWIAWGAPIPDAAAALAVVLIGSDPSPTDRQRTFARLAAALVPDGYLVVVDHNRPRRLGAALTALVRTPWLPGWVPSRRWRRLACPTAREVQAAGLRVERLRLVAGERAQVVVARRA